ncbi:MAG: hypothetical protein JSW52_09985 [Candidatus Coatesbacteria bacterium]|nr:MAG: hypothetical protein JSW52_09985 [Candidatus Coatesbacteria bacterium]
MKKSIVTLLLVIAVALVGYAYSEYSGTAGRGGYFDYHDNSNVLLKVWDVMGEGDVSGDGAWIYPRVGGEPHLYVSGFWVGTDCHGAIKVSVSYQLTELEFDPVLDLVMSDDAGWPGGIPVFSDLDSYVRCNDDEAGEAGPIAIEVERHGYSFSAPPKDDFIGFQYKIYNNNDEDLTNVYISRPCDFDVGGETSYLDDLVGHDSSRNMPYMYDGVGGHGYIGVVCPQGTPLGSKVWDIMNDPETDVAKFDCMTNATWETGDTPDDWRVMYNTGPYTIPVDGYITVAFITVSGDDLADLQANADEAMDSYPGDTGTVNIVPSSIGRVKALYK